MLPGVAKGVKIRAPLRLSSARDRAGRSGVKAGLTPNRAATGWRERREYAAFIRRVLRAYARRLAASNVDALTDITGFATELDRLGITRRAAQQRWGDVQ